MSTTTDVFNSSITKHVATLLDDMITWRTIGTRQSDTRETTNIQPHGGAWMPADRSFDRILFWRTVENNAFQLFEYSMSRNLSHNALQIQFGQATTVLPNVFIVEIPDRQQICLMFVTHIGIYRWIIKHPTITQGGQSDQSQSILADITDDYLNNREHFYRHDLQLYHQVTCAYTNNHLIYALYNEMETILLRFDNQNHLNTPQQFIFPKRPSTGLFNFLWNPNKSVSTTQQNQPIICGQTTIIYNNMTMTIILYENGLLRFLSDQLDTVLSEHNLSDDLPRLSSSKTSKKIFLDYCQYETFTDELITRLFVLFDSNDLLHLLIYEFQYDQQETFRFSVYQNKTYTKAAQTTEYSHLPYGSSLTSITCTNDRLILQFLTNQNRSILFFLQYELKTHNREEFLQLPMNLNENSTTIDEIERRLNSPGEFTIDMIKEAFWITFNCNLDEFNQSWTTITQILQQLPLILQTICNDHCDENAIPNEDRLQILTKFWQNLYSTLIDLRAHALVLLGCRIFDERQLIILIHKSAISLYSITTGTATTNVKYSRAIKDIETLMKISDEETLARMDDDLFDDTTDQRSTRQKFNRIERHLEPIVNNDHLLESLQSIYDQYSTKIDSNQGNRTNTYSSKIARRLLVLVFVEQCQEKIKQIEGLTKLLPLSFRSNQIHFNANRLDKIQEKILPYLHDLLHIYQLLRWISSCGTELSTVKIDDRDLFIENLLQQQYKTRIGNQSLLEQILADRVPQEQVIPDADNWFEIILNSVNHLFSLLWPNNDFLITYLSTRHQWTILDQYCGKLHWLKELNSSRSFFHALAMYRSGTNVEIATRHLAAVLKDLHIDPLLIKMFAQQSSAELRYIEWIREYLKYFGQSQHVASFLHQSLQSSYSNEIRALIIKELFKTSIELHNFDDALWCIQNTSEYLSQKQFIFDYALAVCSSSNDQALYRLQTLIQYQRDRLGYIDLELLAYLECTCVENQPIQATHVEILYKIYQTIHIPLKMAQIMYHYGCSSNDLKEQKNAFQLALNALLSMEENSDRTDRLFIYPINSEYKSICPLNPNQTSTRLIGVDECRQKLATITAIYALKSNRSSSNIQITDSMHPTQLSGLLTKFHYHAEAQQLLDAYHINNKSSMYSIH